MAQSVQLSVHLRLRSPEWQALASVNSSACDWGPGAGGGRGVEVPGVGVRAGPCCPHSVLSLAPAPWGGCLQSSGAGGPSFRNSSRGDGPWPNAGLPRKESAGKDEWIRAGRCCPQSPHRTLVLSSGFPCPAGTPLSTDQGLAQGVSTSVASNRYYSISILRWGN